MHLWNEIVYLRMYVCNVCARAKERQLVENVKRCKILSTYYALVTLVM